MTENKKLQGEVDRSDAAFKSIEQSLADKDVQLDRLKEEVEAGRETVRQLEREAAGRDSLSTECVQLKEELQTRQIQNESLENQIKVLN